MSLYSLQIEYKDIGYYFGVSTMVPFGGRSTEPYHRLCPDPVLGPTHRSCLLSRIQSRTRVPDNEMFTQRDCTPNRPADTIPPCEHPMTQFVGLLLCICTRLKHMSHKIANLL